jgi:hypothetical protein
VTCYGTTPLTLHARSALTSHKPGASFNRIRTSSGSRRGPDRYDDLIASRISRYIASCSSSCTRRHITLPVGRLRTARAAETLMMGSVVSLRGALHGHYADQFQSYTFHEGRANAVGDIPFSVLREGMNDWFW